MLLQLQHVLCSQETNPNLHEVLCCGSRSSSSSTKDSYCASVAHLAASWLCLALSAAPAARSLGVLSALAAAPPPWLLQPRTRWGLHTTLAAAAASPCRGLLCAVLPSAGHPKSKAVDKSKGRWEETVVSGLCCDGWWWLRSFQEYHCMPGQCCCLQK
jgi:hypothetical protein